MKQGCIVVDCIQPVHIGLGEYVVVLTCGHSGFDFVLNALGGVHQVPFAVGYGRDSGLGLEADIGLVGVAAALGGDDNHTVGCTGSVNGSGGGILEHGHALDVGRVDGVEVRCGDGDSVQNVERCGAGVDGVGTADYHGGGSTRLTG